MLNSKNIKKEINNPKDIISNRIPINSTRNYIDMIPITLDNEIELKDEDMYNNILKAQQLIDKKHAIHLKIVRLPNIII